MRKQNKRIEFKIAADGSSASGKTTGGKIIAKKLNMKERERLNFYMKIMNFTS